MIEDRCNDGHTSAMSGIEGLDRLLETARQPALQELRALLSKVLPRHRSGARLIGEQMLLRSRVHRLRFEIDGQPHSVIAKHFRSNRAQRERSALVRWLPSAGFDAHVPVLLGTAAENSGKCIWHVYEDLGDWTLDRGPFEADRVRAAVELVARVHARFARHRMLGEVRMLGSDFGPGFFSACIRDAANALRAVRPPAVALSEENLALRDRLLRRLDALEREQHFRAAAMAEAGGVETLAHGDLWTKNIMVLPPDQGSRPVILIDWDHVGVGPVVYDLSVLLLRFDRDRRPWVLDLYRAALGREAGWRLPDPDRLNQLFETCEYARLANALLWPAIVASGPSGAWAFEQMAEVERWFEALQPVLS